MRKRALLEPGTKVQDYVLVERLGAGAFGEVWKVAHQHLPRVAAMKFATSDEAAELLAREGVTQFGLDHPGIVKVLDASLAHEPPYILLEYVEGRTLRSLLRERGRLEIADATAIFRKLCDAVAHAHGRGAVHGDLKPENVIVRPSGEPVLTDFGLPTARLELDEYLRGASGDGVRPSLLTRPAPGTFHYLAPEQERGEEIDGRADIYALGVLLFEMLTGSLPEGRDLPSDLNPAISWWWDHIFSRCYTGRERRYASLFDLRADLDAASLGPGYGQMPSQKRAAAAIAAKKEKEQEQEQERKPESVEVRALRRLAERVSVQPLGASGALRCPRGPATEALPRGGIISVRKVGGGTGPEGKTAVRSGARARGRASPRCKAGATTALAVLVCLVLAIGLPAVVLGTIAEWENPFGEGLSSPAAALAAFVTSSSSSPTFTAGDGCRPARIGPRPADRGAMTVLEAQLGEYARILLELRAASGPNERARLEDDLEGVSRRVQARGYRIRVVNDEDREGGGFRVEGYPQRGGGAVLRVRPKPKPPEAGPAS